MFLIEHVMLRKTVIGTVIGKIREIEPFCTYIGETGYTIYLFVRPLLNIFLVPTVHQLR